MKVNLRMNLSDFIDTTTEAEVMSKLETIHKDAIKYYLTLWYPDGKIKPTRLKKFILDYEKSLHLKTNIIVGSDLKPNQFIWFDLNNGQIYVSCTDWSDDMTTKYGWTDNLGIYLLHYLYTHRPCCTF